MARNIGPIHLLFLMGSGIRGGQTIGQFDPNCFGQSIDLQSGELDANGTKLLPGILGELLLLSLGDADPQKYTDALPIQAIIGS